MDIVSVVKDISEPTSTPNSDIEGISTVKTRVYKWLTGVWTKMHRNNSVAIQQWVDSLPCPETSNGTGNSTSVMTNDTTNSISPETPPEPDKPMESSVAAPIAIPHRMMGYETSVLTDSPRLRKFLYREASMQSDSAGSHSSVESLLESRRADPEAILLSLGFGPSQAQDDLARIPARFLQPSRMRGINTEEFLRQRQRDAETHDNGVHGYRGLTGNPHSPPSTLVAKIMERLRANSERVLMVSPPLSSEHSDHEPEHDRLPE